MKVTKEILKQLKFSKAPELSNDDTLFYLGDWTSQESIGIESNEITKYNLTALIGQIACYHERKGEQNFQNKLKTLINCGCSEETTE